MRGSKRNWRIHPSVRPLSFGLRALNPPETPRGRTSRCSKDWLLSGRFRVPQATTCSEKLGGLQQRYLLNCWLKSRSPSMTALLSSCSWTTSQLSRRCLPTAMRTPHSITFSISTNPPRFHSFRWALCLAGSIRKILEHFAHRMMLLHHSVELWRQGRLGVALRPSTGRFVGWRDGFLGLFGHS